MFLLLSAFDSGFLDVPRKVTLPNKKPPFLLLIFNTSGLLLLGPCGRVRSHVDGHRPQARPSDCQGSPNGAENCRRVAVLFGRKWQTTVCKKCRNMYSKATKENDVCRKVDAILKKTTQKMSCCKTTNAPENK